MASKPLFPRKAVSQHFGQKVPDITRKITACVACRKQKIKCHMGPEGTCSRCRKRGLSCTVNKSLQMILESDVDWKDAIEARINSLETDFSKMAGYLHTADFVGKEVDVSGAMPSSHQTEMGALTHPTPTVHSPPNYELVMDPDSGPATIPGLVVSAVSMLDQQSGKPPERDIISRGIISRDRAQAFLDIYQNRLDHFLYRILGDWLTLDQVRASSSLMLCSICAVGALHLSASPEFELCYQEFVSLASSRSFSRKYNTDDVRGLCIAAFWLSGISWACVGAAVRMSTELGLHRSIFKSLTGDRTHYLRTRLYYLVYVCDHHFSIAYGRPPMTREDDAIQLCMKFLDNEHAVEDDTRLVSQVQFWAVGSEIYDVFGIEVEHPLGRAMVEQSRRLGIRLDEIRVYWTERFGHNPYVGNYPRKGVGLHFHFSKLYLHSMAFRGIGKPEFRRPEVAADLDEMANSAMLSATAILTAVVSDTEIQGYLNGLPTYFDMMIAFAVVFALKVSTKYSSSVKVDTSTVRALVADLITVLKRLTLNMHRDHLLVSIARGVELLLQGYTSTATTQCPVPANAHVTMAQTSLEDATDDIFGEWYPGSVDSLFIGGCDFLFSPERLNHS